MAAISSCAEFEVRCANIEQQSDISTLRSQVSIVDMLVIL
jgi:hypothetical protein